MSGVTPYHREFKEHPAMADFHLPIQRKVGNAVLCSPEWSRVSDKLALTATAERDSTFSILISQLFGGVIAMLGFLLNNPTILS